MDQLLFKADMRFGGMGIFRVSARRTGSFIGERAVSIKPRHVWPSPWEVKPATYHVLPWRKLGPPLFVDGHICVVLGGCWGRGSGGLSGGALLHVDKQLVVLLGGGERHVGRHCGRLLEGCRRRHRGGWDVALYTGFVELRSAGCKIGEAESLWPV